jgi:hypothetical protein
MEIQGSSEIDAALKFINDYTELCNSGPIDKTWIERNKLLTENFKKTYSNLFDSANKEDPELGLDFDPIFDAQDFPDKGFELVKCDSLGYVTVSGIDWPDFILVLKLVQEGNKWLVDGCGVINIQLEKRAKK